MARNKVDPCIFCGENPCVCNGTAKPRPGRRSGARSAPRPSAGADQADTQPAADPAGDDDQNEPAHEPARRRSELPADAWKSLRRGGDRGKPRLASTRRHGVTQVERTVGSGSAGRDNDGDSLFVGEPERGGSSVDWNATKRDLDPTDAAIQYLIPILHDDELRVRGLRRPVDAGTQVRADEWRREHGKR